MQCKSSEVEGDIAKVKAELDEKYYLLGKMFCEIADKDIAKINELVDRIVELKAKTNKNSETEQR